MTSIRTSRMSFSVCWLAIGVVLIIGWFYPAGANGEPRPRVIVSTDIGGSDPDDFQSMVHLLLYADVLDIEGLVSSPWGEGRVDDILEVIDAYEADYPNLRTYTNAYPAPDALRAVVRQGATGVAPYQGYGESTEGSDWIVRVARRPDARPLHVLVWGGIEDLAQALHDAPDILPKLRVYAIGGPNKKWSPDAYHYLTTEHPDLWMIESNSTYRGWFVGGDQSGDWGNESFVERRIAGRGALGDYFVDLLGGTIKMGDTPAVAWLLNGTPADPAAPGWGGSYVRAWERPYDLYTRVTTADDEIEAFGIFELRLPVDSPDAEAHLVIENQSLAGHVEDGTIRFRFSLKAAKTFTYRIDSNVPGLDGQRGAITAVAAAPDAAAQPDTRWPNWWTDDPDPTRAEGEHQGAATVSRWRVEFLEDFSRRLERARMAVGPDVAGWSAAVLQRPADWYGTAEAMELADNVLRWQSEEGAWPKNTDLTQAPSPALLEEVRTVGRANTIDNDATVQPMQYLALVASATGEARYEQAFLRGMDYLFEAQYENGGWPQFYPLRPSGYYSRITFNDNAMMNVMFLLRDVARGDAPFGFVDDRAREKAADAVRRGTDCILRTQVRQGGKLTGWAAQYDEVTLEPAWARAYEPPSLSGMETVPVVRFLMGIEAPGDDEIAAVEGAVRWLNDVAIHDQRYLRGINADGQEDAWVVPEPGAGPYWARFYDLETSRPIFTGRDSVIRPSLAEIEAERRGGYAYYGTWPATLVEQDYPRWRDRIATR